MSEMMTAPDRVDAAAVRAGHEAYLFPCLKPYYAEPLVLVRGSGTWVTDADGHEYLDLFSGILSTSVGHCNPEVVDRVCDQVQRLGHISTLYLHDQQVEAAQRLAAIAPGRLDRTFFTNSGTEAVETAVMLACMYTGKSEIIALRYGYSGRSALATNLTGQAPWRPLVSAAAAVRHTISPYAYRCPFHSPAVADRGAPPPGVSASTQNHDRAGCDDRCLDAFANDLEEVIQTTTNGRPAAFMAETIQGAGGYIVPPAGYFNRMVEIIHRYGGVFICDEVQAGFGRTGDHWFGIEHWDVEPDIMVMAKGIANGFPVGATIARSEIAEAWTGKTISTFGGNPVSMAATVATNDVMVREDVPARAAERGRQLRTGMDALGERYAWIGDVRGMGLMQAMELVTDPVSKRPDGERAHRLLEACRAEGILVGTGGMDGHIIRIGPQLLISEEETALALERLTRACERTEREEG